MVFRIPGDASDPWMCMAALASWATLLTVSKGGVVTLWSSATGKAQGKQHLSSIKEETPTCAVSVQKPGKMVIGCSKGSISLVSSFIKYDASIHSGPKCSDVLKLGENSSPLIF